MLTGFVPGRYRGHKLSALRVVVTVLRIRDLTHQSIALGEEGINISDNRLGCELAHHRLAVIVENAGPPRRALYFSIEAAAPANVLFAVALQLTGFCVVDLVDHETVLAQIGTRPKKEGIRGHPVEPTAVCVETAFRCFRKRVGRNRLVLSPLLKATFTGVKMVIVHDFGGWIVHHEYPNAPDFVVFWDRRAFDEAFFCFQFLLALFLFIPCLVFLCAFILL
mmetsp:Transcript_32035/g.78007  ORF Transcript_32035/g.78007 Transcript_32035/m.78007 type:complete len:222 (+) Transcript_32035:1726-2391(+)